MYIFWPHDLALMSKLGNGVHFFTGVKYEENSYGW